MTICNQEISGNYILLYLNLNAIIKVSEEVTKMFFFHRVFCNKVASACKKVISINTRLQQKINM